MKHKYFSNYFAFKGFFYVRFIASINDLFASTMPFCDSKASLEILIEKY